MKVKLLSHVRLFVTPWIAAYQASPSMGFYQQGTGVGYHCLLQGIFPTQELNPGLPYCRQMLYPLSHQRSPKWHAPPGKKTRVARMGILRDTTTPAPAIQNWLDSTPLSPSPKSLSQNPKFAKELPSPLLQSSIPRFLQNSLPQFKSINLILSD